MKDRFKFRAIVKGYYYIDTLEKCEEFEPKIFLKDVDVLSNGQIGIQEKDLECAIREQHPSIEDDNVEFMLEGFRDNSDGIDSYVTINPKVIYQATGLKDVNGKLIYEGDIIKYMYYNPKRYTKWVVVFDQNTLEFGLKDYRYGGYLRITRHSILNNKVEIIGNKFQNTELLNEVENDT